jgi:hypothetical protein
MGIGEISDAFFRIFCLSRRICNTIVTPYMIKFISMRFLRVIKLTKAEKNLPLAPEDYMLTFIPDYPELVRKDCKVLECNVDEITEITAAKGENR